MLLSYQDCIKKFGSDYRIKNELANETLFQKEKGIYSTSRNPSEIDVIMYKFPHAVCTGKSAFYYLSLSDVIPDRYYLATKRTDSRIKDSRICQSFLTEEIFDHGIIELHRNSSSIRVYSPERMLIELMRFKAILSMDYYKEIIHNYRQRIYEMDFSLVEDYAALFRSGPRLLKQIQAEVL